MSTSCQIIPHHSEVAAGCKATLHESVLSIVYNHNMSRNAEINHKWNKPAAIFDVLLTTHLSIILVIKQLNAQILVL